MNNMDKTVIVIDDKDNSIYGDKFSAVKNVIPDGATLMLTCSTKSDLSDIVNVIAIKMMQLKKNYFVIISNDNIYDIKDVIRYVDDFVNNNKSRVAFAYGLNEKDWFIVCNWKLVRKYDSFNLRNAVVDDYIDWLKNKSISESNVVIKMDYGDVVAVKHHVSNDFSGSKNYYAKKRRKKSKFSKPLNNEG